MKHWQILHWRICVAGLLATLACGLNGCPAVGLRHQDATISGNSFNLMVSSPDCARLPLYDRVDVLLLPEGVDIGEQFSSSTQYFNAISKAGGSYLGGDYLQDTERSTGSASYDVSIQFNAPAQGQIIWAYCLRLEDTSITVLRRISLGPSELQH